MQSSLLLKILKTEATICYKAYNDFEKKKAFFPPIAESFKFSYPESKLEETP